MNHSITEGTRDRPYSVAVIADIHGNADALEVVLDDLKGRSYDALLIAGDLVLSGPKPVQSLDLLRDLNCPTIHGNADLFVIDKAYSGDDLDWVRDTIGRSGIDYITGLPFEHRITPPGGKSPQDDLLVVHATPTDANGVLVLKADKLRNLEVTPEEEARVLLGDAKANLILAGHLHYASYGVPCGQRYAIIDSVGFPFDGDPRAGYATVTWKDNEWQVENHRLKYDHLKVVEDLRHCGASFGEMSAQRLLQARILYTVRA